MTMTSSDLNGLAGAVLMPFLQHAGFVGADVEAMQDHDGQDGLAVTLHFRPGAEIATGAAYLKAQVALQAALQDAGDFRFPYFNYDYPDDPVPFDAEDAYAGE